MQIKNFATLHGKYERLQLIQQARNGKPIAVYGNYRDANAIRVYLFKKSLNIEFHYETIDAERDIVLLKFNQSK